MTLTITFRYVLVCILFILVLDATVFEVGAEADFLEIENHKINTSRSEIPMQIVRNSQQNAILDLIYKIYTFTNSSNERCRNASRAYVTALSNYESWALKMLDASSKLQSAFISGNLYEYGSYAQCVNILKAGPAQQINGKHCMLAVLPPEATMKTMLSYGGVGNAMYEHVRLVFLDSTIEWSICIPDACQGADVFEHFADYADSVFEGLHFTLQPDIQCYTLADAITPFSNTEKVVLFSGIGGALCLVCLLSTVVDIYKRRKEVDEGYEVVFSIVANSSWLIAHRTTHQHMACLNGVRVMSILLVIIGHRYLMSMFFVSVNTFDIVEWFSRYSSQMVIGGTVAVDSFLLLSGLLLTYHFLRSYHSGQKFNYALFLLHRYLRLSPSYGVAILIFAVFTHRFGTGPKWALSAQSVQQPCKEYWWSALLYVQSYVNPKEVCVLQSWYLSCDTLYYALAPLLLIPLARRKHVGLGALFAAYVASAAVNFKQSYHKEWVVNSLINKQIPSSAFFLEHYIQPHIRASPYIIGMVVGYILFEYRDRKVRMPPCVVLIGWTISMTLLVVVVFSHRIFLDVNYVYNPVESATFIALHRSAYVLGLSWIIWACVHGYGGPVNTLLSSHIFEVLARLTYSVFLVHMQLQFFDNGANKTPNYFSNLTLMRKAFGDMAAAFLLGYFLTILVECPAYKLSLLLFKGRKKVASDLGRKNWTGNTPTHNV